MMKSYLMIRALTKFIVLFIFHLIRWSNKNYQKYIFIGTKVANKDFFSLFDK